MELTESLELVERLSRTKKYPVDIGGLNYLAEDLLRAVRETGSNARSIIDECAKNEWCPSYADMLAVAQGLKPTVSQLGPRRCPLDICDGSGWSAIWHLHTRHARPGGAAYVEREAITQAVFDQISSKLAGTNQSVYESRYRCKCHPARLEEIEKRGKYA